MSKGVKKATSKVASKEANKATVEEVNPVLGEAKDFRLNPVPPEEVFRKDDTADIAGELESSQPMEVFLGGTFNDTTWRDELIPMLNGAGIGYFNPVVEDWNKEAQDIEAIQKVSCTHQLYVITPEMTGVFSIAEVVAGAFTDPKNTIFTILEDPSPTASEKFSKSEMMSLEAVADMVASLGVVVCRTLIETLNALTK